jgi:hypothetical protein
MHLMKAEAWKLGFHHFFIELKGWAGRKLAHAGSHGWRGDVPGGLIEMTSRWALAAGRRRIA